MDWAARMRSSHPHPRYLQLGRGDTARLPAYRSWVDETVSPEELERIRQRLQRRPALGADRFRAMIEAQLVRLAGAVKAGRPQNVTTRSDEKIAL